MSKETNPFVVAGALRREDMIDRDREAADLLAFAEGGQPFRVMGPRRYGKTSLLSRVLDDAEAAGMATALVDLEGVLSLEGIVVRLEGAYERRLEGALRRTVDRILRAWDIGVALGGGGFTARLQASPNLHVEGVLQRVLALPETIHERTDKRSLIVFDEVQDLLRVKDAAGAVRSVIQHHPDAAVYGFAGSAPSLMSRLFEDPSQPLLEHAMPTDLGPLPLDAVGDYIEARFERSGRDPGSALTPLIDFTRGHPQRTMLLAHHLWRLTPRAGKADESTWHDALAVALSQTQPTLRVRWEALPLNEQRLAQALASSSHTLYDERTYRSVGLKKGSIEKALSGLVGRGEASQQDDRVRLTDPLFEQWLKTKGAW